MKESDIFSRCKMFAAVTRIEWVDHSWSCLLPGFMFRTAEAADRRSLVTILSVMKRYCPSACLNTPIGSSFGTLRRSARRAMRSAARTGQNFGCSMSRANGICSPLSLFFWWRQRMRTYCMRSISILALRSIKRSSASRNSKSAPIIARGGCPGHSRIRSNEVCDDWHHSLLRKPV